MPPKKINPHNASDTSVGGTAMHEMLDMLRQQSVQLTQQQQQFQQQQIQYQQQQLQQQQMIQQQQQQIQQQQLQIQQQATQKGPNQTVSFKSFQSTKPPEFK